MNHVRLMMTVIALSVATAGSSAIKAEPQLNPKALAFKLPEQILVAEIADAREHQDTQKRRKAAAR